MKAEDFYNKWQLQDIELKSIEPCQFTKEELLNFGKQYAELRIQQEREKFREETKQEVLEALEREIPKAINFYRESEYSEDEIKCYIETQVKPRIESN